MSSLDEQGGRAGRIVTFYSYKGGTGRTMALANVAWILAANGKRVLAVDWDLEAPGLHRFFHPFLDPATVGATTGVIDLLTEYAWAATDDDGEGRPDDWHREYARVQRHAVSVDWAFPEPGTLDLVTAGRQNRDYSAIVATFDWDNFYDRLGGGLFFDALRDDMRANYDYVLIDSRTGLSDIADICTAHLPDVLVDCFTLSDQSIDGAASVARDIGERFRPRNIRILPVPMRIDEGEKEKADAGRMLARAKFDGWPAGLTDDQLTNYWLSVEVPYRPYYAYEETLATFADEAGNPISLLAAFERLTAVVSAQAVTALPRMDEEQRLGVKRKFVRTRAALPADLHLSYVSEDRMWAEWITALLSRAGFRVIPRYAGGEGDGADKPADRTVVVLSPAYQRSARARQVWETATGNDPTGRRQVLAVRVGDIRPAPAFTDWPSVDVVRTNEKTAATALLRALGKPPLTGDLGDDTVGTAAARFPDTQPRFWNVTPRNSSFTGRSALLEKLRDLLGPSGTGGRSAAYALYGLGGVGKTQIALEYVHRFAADYDLVWWISSERSEFVVSALADLAPRLGLRGGEDAAQVAQEVRDHLRQSGPSLRWLLVFDNADEPQEVSHLLPGGSGHVLITSRNQTWLQYGEALEIDPFLREESVEHLLRRAPDLSAEDADRVAAAVGDLPLALEQAGAWLAETATPVDDYLLELDRQAEHVLSLSQPAGYPQPVAATWNVSIERLKERSPAAVRLLQLCAFFAAEPISMKLLYGDEMIRVLAAEDPSLQEKMVLGRVIREIGRFALAKVDRSQQSTIQVHRLVQAVIRSQLTQREQLEAQHVVHRILAGARPSGEEPIDDPENQPTFAAIWPHLDASEASICDDPETRQLLIDRVRYLWKRGELTAAITFAESLRALWEEKLADSRARIAEFAELPPEPDDAPRLPAQSGGRPPRTLTEERLYLTNLRIQLLHLRFHIANILRSFGKYVEAEQVGSDVLAQQRSLLAPDHPHILMTTSGLATDLGSVGRFTEALQMAAQAYLGFKEAFGEDHPRTLSANNNRAVCLRLLGRYNEARDVDQEIYDRRRNDLGAKHPHSLISVSNLGRDLRETGEYDASISLLRGGNAAYAETFGELYPETLRSAKSLAVSLRKAGLIDEARALTHQTRENYRLRETPTTTPDVLDCTLNYAVDLYATGAREEALALTQDIVRQYRVAPGERHPATLAALNNCGIFLRGAGRVQDARVLLESNYATLREVLGDAHPYVLACAVNLANTLAELEELHRSEELERLAVTGFQKALGYKHPDTIVSRANLSVTLRALRRIPEADQLQESAQADLERLLGEGHPHTVSVREGKRIHRDLEPPLI
ncbi:FxSxx-COOH system tetratricopeptide repeat protein [Streptomyces acidiscabies]|uniref:FxSxx-COOH system tetratricopeptide repeat protein n=1 Tax=Streptomyces acidiscabies TaxID=42234 RepID=UPI0030D48A55